MWVWVRDRGRGQCWICVCHPCCGSLCLTLLSFLRLWQCGPQDPCWAPLLCLLWSLRGAALPDVDQRPGQVLRGTCQEAGPVPHQERREPGMSLNPRCRAALGGPWQGTDGRMGKTKNEQRCQGRWQEGSPRAPCPVSEAGSDAACPPLGGEPAPWPPGCPCWASPSPPSSDLVSPPPCQRKAQITCTAIFIVWGVLVHLVIPPFVFMVTEEWDYIEGLYYSFITISTIGFGDFVAGESCPFPLASASLPSLSLLLLHLQFS